MGTSKVPAYSVDLLADRLGQLRLSRQWTREELATRSGVTYHTLTKLELAQNTNPTLKTMLALAKVFEVRLEDLLT